jgi:trehalose 6-phosphate phosphatase
VSLEEVKARLARAALLLDFDGTLSPIVVRSEEAMPVAGADEVLAGLVERAGNVTIVTGRRSGFIRSVVRVEGLDVIGQFGMEDSPALPEEVLAEINVAVAGESGVRVVDKSASIAVHVRTTPDPDAATVRIAGPLTAIAERHRLEVLPGKRVLELVRKGSSKGIVVEKVVARTGAEAALYAGDDLNDVPAFDALEILAKDGMRISRIAVVGEETPEELVAKADLTVAGPEELVALLREL